MNTLFFGLLAITSLFIFMKLGKIKASKKQLDRTDRINWGKNKQQNINEEIDISNFSEEKTKEINDQSEK